MSPQVLEGTWEEIAVYAAQLAGKRVRLTVLEEAPALINTADYVATVNAVREGIESFERGEGRPAREALEELRQKYGISR